MKKEKKVQIKRVLALVLAAALLFTSILLAVFSAMGQAEEITEQDRYEIQIEIDEKLLGAKVSECFFYTNKTGHPLTQLYFALPVNAFRRQETFPFDSDELDAAFPSGLSIGGSSISSITVNGEIAQWGVQGSQETILRVECDLAENESCEIGFTLETVFPFAEGYVGYGDMGFRLYGIFPVLAAYDAELETFVVNDYTMLDASVFAEAADFSIQVNTPAGYTVAAGGTNTMTKASDGSSIWDIQIEDCRYPMITVSNQYRLYEDTNTRVYASSNSFARSVLTASEKVCKVYESWFGTFPYGKLTVAQGDLLRDISAGGVLLLTGEDTEFAVAYGMAKLYFGEYVGNNHATEAWLSDALPYYIALLYFEEQYGYDRFLQELNNRVLPALNTTYPGAVYPDSELTLFSTYDVYEAIVMQRGAACMHEIRGLVGRDKFIEGISTLCEEQKGKIASIADFADCMNRAYGKDTDYFMMEMFRSISDYTNAQLTWYE